MNDKAFANPEAENTLVAEAWAIAAMQPARQGARGYCASAWIITYDGWKTATEPDIRTSHAAGRDPWMAGIMAIRGVLENVERGSRLTIFVANKELAGCYDKGWRNKNGPSAGADLAAPIFQMRDEFRLELKIEHRPYDARGLGLKKAASGETKAKDALLTDDERRAVPAFDGASDFNKTGGFPKVEPDTDDA